MENIFSPQMNSDENLKAFLDSISDEKIKIFLSDNLDELLALGADSSNNELKEELFTLIDNIVIEKLEKVGQEDENKKL